VTTVGAPAATAVGRLSQLDQPTRARLESACSYINAEIAKVRGRLAKVAIALAVTGIVAYAFMWRAGIVDPRLPLFGALAIFVGWAGFEHSRLSKTYKQIVIGRIVAALGKDLFYSPAPTFAKQDFRDMDLFRMQVQNWKAEDEVSGKKDAVEYSMFEAKATRTEGSGKNRRTVTIFKGLIVRLDFNKNFRGHTIVVPNSDSQILGGLFGESESRNDKQLCRMDSVTFEETFSVYSTDQQEARYILTPKFMELILAAHAKFTGVRCCFQNSSLFLTIPSDANRFELRLWGARITPEAAVGDLAECVDLAGRLIDALDLETRIWSKV
jgi:hypothetical protein